MGGFWLVVVAHVQAIIVTMEQAMVEVKAEGIIHHQQMLAMVSYFLKSSLKLFQAQPNVIQIVVAPQRIRALRLQPRFQPQLQVPLLDEVFFPKNILGFTMILSLE